MPEETVLSPNPLLTEYYFSYSMEGLIGKQVIPVASVKKRTFRVRVVNGNPRRIPNNLTAPRSRVNQIEIEASILEFTVKDHYLEAAVDAIEAEEAEFDELAETSEEIKDLNDLEYEKAVADIVFSAATYPAANKIDLTGDPNRFTEPGARPLDVLLTGMNATVRRPNTLVIGYGAYIKLATNAQVLQGLGKTTGGSKDDGQMASGADLARWLGVPGMRVLVGAENYDSSKPGKTSVNARIWGNHVALLYIVPQPTRRSMTFAATFSNVQSYATNFFDPHYGPRGATFVKAGWDYIISVMNSSYGYFIENAA